MIKRLLILCFVLAILGGIGGYAGYHYVKSTLPQMITLQDYKPLLLTQVFDRNKKKIGEFYNERRVLVPYEKIPKKVINAFIAAEDDQFFTHNGVNYLAIFRAMFANLKSGRKAQGASTITQQVARTLLLTNEKSYVRKVREILLAHQMEESLSKEDILYLYLNQIYFGSGAHGIAMAAETYFRKNVEDLNLAESAILAGLPKAPSDYSPIRNPQAAKDRQNYVLNRMRDVGFITKEEAQAAKEEPVKVFLRESYEEHAPFFLETVRLLLIPKVGEEKLLNEGLTVETSLDLKKQLAAQAATEAGLKELDKRQGYRGAQSNITDPQEVGDFLLKSRNKLILEANPARIIQADGKFQDYGPLNLKYDISKGLPPYLKVGKSVEGIVSRVDDSQGLVVVKIAEVEGAIDFKTMDWARKPNAEKRYDLDTIKKPSQALKMGDVILVKIRSAKFGGKSDPKKKGAVAAAPAKFIEVELDQIPIVEAGVLSIEQGTGDILAMVGGYDYKRDKFNRAIQAARQTGSSFKTIVYASAFDKGYTASTPILDAPLVYDEGKGASEDAEGQEESKVWKPVNHGHNYSGDIIFRNAIVKSLNIPTVKIIEDISVPWVADYARRMGVFSALNMDFTLALGSSSVTLYEMTKMFAQIATLGKRVRPMLVHKVTDSQGSALAEKITLDEKFQEKLNEIDQQFEERRKKYFDLKQSGKEIDKKKVIDANFFFDDPEQLIRPQTAYLATTLLKAVIDDKDGTGGRAKALGRDVAGKTGSSSGYFDAWFIGFTPQITTGVWVGFNQEKSIGKGEVGGRAALPIWLDYMKAAHDELPQMTFPVPEGITFANIDAETGLLASTKSKSVIRQAFLEGTEPSSVKAQKEEETDFYKQDLNE